MRHMPTPTGLTPKARLARIKRKRLAHLRALRRVAAARDAFIEEVDAAKDEGLSHRFVAAQLGMLPQTLNQMRHEAYTRRAKQHGETRAS